MKQFRLVAVYMPKRLPVSEKRSFLRYLYSFSLSLFWSCRRLNGLLNVNIKNHINAFKTLFWEPVSNTTRKVLPAVLLEIVWFSRYDSLDCSCTIYSFSSALRTACGWFSILVEFYEDIRFSIRITKLTIHWKCWGVCMVFEEEKLVQVTFRALRRYI